jgi:hypothetical protein
LLKALHSVYYEEESRDDKLLGQQICAITANLLKEAPKKIKESGLDCADVLYHNLVENPLQTVRDIYAQFGWEVSAEYEANLKAYLEKDEKKRARIREARIAAGTAASPRKAKSPSAGTAFENAESSESTSTKVLHHYDPSEFFLTKEQLSEGVFAEYVSRYNLPMSIN